MKNRSLLLLATFCLASCYALAQQDQAPTLADIARQKRAQKSKKVITSEDMKAAPAEPAPAAEAEGTAEAKPATIQSSEAIAAAQAKVEDIRYREMVLNRSIARFETSLAAAQQEGNEDRAKTYQESLDAAKASLAQATADRTVAEKNLDQMKADAAAAAGAAAAKKKPARRPAPSTPKS